MGSSNSGRGLGERTFSSRLLGKAPLNILANIELPSCAKTCTASNSMDATMACCFSLSMRPGPARSDHDANEARRQGLGNLRVTKKQLYQHEVPRPKGARPVTPCTKSRDWL